MSVGSALGASILDPLRVPVHSATHDIRVIDAGADLSARSPDRLLAELPDGRGGWRAIDLVVVSYP